MTGPTITLEEARARLEAKPRILDHEGVLYIEADWPDVEALLASEASAVAKADEAVKLLKAFVENNALAREKANG